MAKKKQMVSPIIESRTSRNRLMAAFLAILFGTVGIHKFYLGKPWWGLVYILFSWSFLPFVVGLLEGVSYLLMSDKEFAIRYP